MVSAAVPSLALAVGDPLGAGVTVALGVGVNVFVGVGVADLEALGDGLAVVALTLPAFQSVATNRTIGDTKELSIVSFVIPVWAAKTLAASSWSDL